LKIIKYNLSTAYPRIIIFLFLAFSSGCAMINQIDSPPPPQPEIINNALPFVDVPVPSGFSRDQVKSFVYETGSNEMKVGRLFFNGRTGLKPTVEFFQNEMVNKGWTLVNSMASTETILNYRKEGWVCTVIVRPRSFSRSNIEIQIGPVQMKSQ